MFAALLAQEVEVSYAVSVYEEHVLAVVPTLGDMVRESGYDDACVSWYGQNGSKTSGGKTINRLLSPICRKA